MQTLLFRAAALALAYAAPVEALQASDVLHNAVNMHDVPAWAALALSIGTSIYAVLKNNSKAHAEDFARVVKLVDGQNDRLTKMESEHKYLPTKDMVHGLQISLATMGGKMDVIATRLASVDAISRRVQDAMMERDT